MAKTTTTAAKAPESKPETPQETPFGGILGKNYWHEKGPLRKQCPECQEYHHTARNQCPACGHEYEATERKPRNGTTGIVINSDTLRAISSLNAWLSNYEEPHEAIAQLEAISDLVKLFGGVPAIVNAIKAIKGLTDDDDASD